MKVAIFVRRLHRAGHKYTTDTTRRILRVLDLRPPDGYGSWTGPLIAKALGDVDVQQVWRVLRAHKIDLAARKSWCESNDPDFAASGRRRASSAKAAEVVGLYLAPPENAIVISVDEKPSTQALGCRQGYLKTPNGRALSGQSHDYKRHGTTTLFAALNVATRKVSGRQYKRRRRITRDGTCDRIRGRSASVGSSGGIDQGAVEVLEQRSRFQELSLGTPSAA